ncbi:unnamed protein product [Spirodela intermedia]|uniref:Cyclin-like domain-containing protein n=1 Tax=Spirodela intermedia TaxID=51605 RepID=A0A7I8J0Q1_SPIIN|nr:unnamed protein product [Spirodela intermedia]CAA6662991.1 unnamed protein product [Spirodela intermedia]
MQPRHPLVPSLHCGESADDLESSWEDATDGGAAAPPPPPPPAAVADDSHRPISDILAAEASHLPEPGYSDRFLDGGSLDAAARLDAVDWIFKVNAVHGFPPTTAFLSVNYLDRFVSSQLRPMGVSWTWRLVAVACLSVAAKMEETAAPPPEERMELLLMTALRWRMRPVTPFDFVGFFSGILSSGGTGAGPASDVILATQRVAQFIGQRPSAIAAAAVLFTGGAPAEEEGLSRLYEVVNKEEVEVCRRLMEEHFPDTSRLPREPNSPAASPPTKRRRFR